MVIDKIRKMPQMGTDHNVTLEVSSFLFNIGEMKNKKNNPLKANILLAPVKKILSKPSAKIGKERSIFNISATKIKVNKILNNAIGTMMVFVLIIDFFPIIFATTPINKKKNRIKEIG